MLHALPWLHFDIIYKLINCPAGNIEQENVYSKFGGAMLILIGRISWKEHTIIIIIIIVIIVIIITKIYNAHIVIDKIKAIVKMNRRRGQFAS